jgi:hypothetical protein
LVKADAEEEVDEADKEAEEAEGLNDDDAVVESVAGDAAAGIVATDSGPAAKTPPSTAEGVDWLALEVLLLSKIIDTVNGSSIVTVNSEVVVK